MGEAQGPASLARCGTTHRSRTARCTRRSPTSQLHCCSRFAGWEGQANGGQARKWMRHAHRKRCRACSGAVRPSISKAVCTAAHRAGKEGAAAETRTGGGGHGPPEAMLRMLWCSAPPEPSAAAAACSRAGRPGRPVCAAAAAATPPAASSSGWPCCGRRPGCSTSNAARGALLITPSRVPSARRPFGSLPRGPALDSMSGAPSPPRPEALRDSQPPSDAPSEACGPFSRCSVRRRESGPTAGDVRRRSAPRWDWEKARSVMARNRHCLVNTNTCPAPPAQGVAMPGVS